MTLCGRQRHVWCISLQVLIIQQFKIVFPTLVVLFFSSDIQFSLCYISMRFSAMYCSRPVFVSALGDVSPTLWVLALMYDEIFHDASPHRFQIGRRILNKKLFMKMIMYQTTVGTCAVGATGWLSSDRCEQKFKQANSEAAPRQCARHRCPVALLQRVLDAY